MVDYSQFVQRLQRLRESVATICQQCNRSPSSVEILAVTKVHPLRAIQFAAEAGILGIGENRVQEAMGKFSQASCPPIRKELIGPLQRNKAKLAVQYFDRIQSVDSLKLAHKIDTCAADLDKTQAILLQINVDDDPHKSGFSLTEAPIALEACLEKDALRVEGLMTIGLLTTDPQGIRKTFKRLATLHQQLQEQFNYSLPELSMGMSNDYSLAIEQGSTQIRVGTQLYGSRPQKNG